MRHRELVRMNAQRVLIVIGAALIAVGAWYFLAKGPRPDDREQIIQMVVEVEQAVEARRTSTVISYFSEDYKDTMGYDRRSLQRFLMAGLHNSDGIDVVTQLGEIDVQGDTATVHVEADYAFGGSAGGDGSAHMSVDVTLQRERGGWKIVRADGWQGSMLEGL